MHDQLGSNSKHDCSQSMRCHSPRQSRPSHHHGQQPRGRLRVGKVSQNGAHRPGKGMTPKARHGAHRPGKGTLLGMREKTSHGTQLRHGMMAETASGTKAEASSAAWQTGGRKQWQMPMYKPCLLKLKQSTGMKSFRPKEKNGGQ